MNAGVLDVEVRGGGSAHRHAIARLAHEASIEINVQDMGSLAASREFLPAKAKIYVSHLPQQTWEETQQACRAVSESGFSPVPHIPVRLLTDPSMLERVVSELAGRAGVGEILLISGDYPQALGPYSAVIEVLRTGVLERQGIRKVSFAGHPEGHPRVAPQLIRRVELEKSAVASLAGVEPTLVTQFFFEHAPFLHWVNELRSQGIQSKLVAGLPGPASLRALFKFATRCGVGRSIRALGARPTSLAKLIGDRGPESLLYALAQAQVSGGACFDGVHLFCFGGFLRTCEWLHRVSCGDFELTPSGFEIR